MPQEITLIQNLDIHFELLSIKLFLIFQPIEFSVSK